MFDNDPPREETEIDSAAVKVGRLLAAVECGTNEIAKKATVADFIRLIQAYKEYEQPGPKRIEVRWVTPPIEAES
ncbi:MAG TPA: hypothetical protein VEQ63_13095 [Bryobacteraceae bacterium]|nr:hypothetical protein [Bryobacteraceae bacterium]